MKRIISTLFAGMICMFTMYAQIQLTGVVKTESGDPLPGANIYFEGSDYGTTTGLTGTFFIEKIQPGIYTLIVSYIGYAESRQELDLSENKRVEIVLREKDYLAEEIVVSGIRATENTPTTHTFINKEEIEKNNLGKDVPYLLSMEPSVVVTSDAGAGIGYSGMRIRGVDSRQINVTINGVPLNDAESHGVFWVDIPDIAGSTEGIQVQRGIGTSTNGSGAFGGSINLTTENIALEPYAELSGSMGSFNTNKYSVEAGTGLINDHWFLEGKYSQIHSDGFRDRAWSDLTSYFLQGGYYGENTIVKALAFGGREETYQAWYSVTQDEMDVYGRTFNPAGIIYNPDWSIKGYYDNFIDHYNQDHYQLHLIQQISPFFTFNAGLHYTYGRGYYEEYMQEELLQYYPMEFYNLEPLYFGLDSLETEADTYDYFYHDTIKYSDVIRRLWLDNDFYGTTWSLNFNQNQLNVVLGGAYNKYANGKHFGEVIWARYASNSLPGHPFYYNESEKSDFNSFLKALYQPVERVSLFVDLQYRNIQYTASGLDREWTDGDELIDIDKTYSFFNPKLGGTYRFSDDSRIYLSYAIAHREPNRSDFLDALDGIEPKPEQLGDLETGIVFKRDHVSFELVGYYMRYTNQLVLTGQLNDIGTPIRKNVGESFRRGIELSGSYNIASFIQVAGNLTLSENKTSYTSYDAQDSSFVKLADVRLSYSPAVVANGMLRLVPFKRMEVGLNYKYVGDQFVDNAETYKLPGYGLLDLRVNYQINLSKFSEVSLFVNAYNLLNKKYSSYGVVHWSGNIGHFPQAGINLLMGVLIKI